MYSQMSASLAIIYIYGDSIFEDYMAFYFITIVYYFDVFFFSSRAYGTRLDFSNSILDNNKNYNLTAHQRIF